MQVRQHLTAAGHLVARFLGHVTAAPLRPAEQRWVARRLPSAEARLFFDQDPADQRHAYEVARRVERRGDVAVRAALLHDVGKRHAGIGAVRRSLATLMDLAGLPLPARWRAYRDHGRRGAEELERAGADALSVAFARHHPSGPPPGVDTTTWRALLEADGGS